MTIEDPYKRELLDWEIEQDQVRPENLDKWHKGDFFNRLPSKSELRMSGLDAVSLGWLPEKPIINPETRVLGIGSCFARYFILWLAEHGFNQSFDRSPYNALLRYGADFENVSVIAQQFRWAFEEFAEGNAFWIDKDKQFFEATEDNRILVRNTLQKTDVLILTLGLSEVWYDKITNEPLWRAVPAKYYDPDRHAFKVESLVDTMHSLENIDNIRERFLPNLKIVFTVSPVRLKATFRPISALSANSFSKANLRAALDEFLRSRQTSLNSKLYYFPAYEMVRDFFRDPYREDNRHLCSYVPGKILSYFGKTYCSGIMEMPKPNSIKEYGVPELQKVLDIADQSDDDAFSNELIERISELEMHNAELQQICDDRQRVIEELNHAAQERLDLIIRLSAELKKLK